MTAVLMEAFCKHKRMLRFHIELAAPKLVPGNLGNGLAEDITTQKPVRCVQTEISSGSVQCQASYRTAKPFENAHSLHL